MGFRQGGICCQTFLINNIQNLAIFQLLKKGKEKKNVSNCWHTNSYLRKERIKHHNKGIQTHCRINLCLLPMMEVPQADWLESPCCFMAWNSKGECGSKWTPYTPLKALLGFSAPSGVICYLAISHSNWTDYQNICSWEMHQLLVTENFTPHRKCIRCPKIMPHHKLNYREERCNALNIINQVSIIAEKHQVH